MIVEKNKRLIENHNYDVSKIILKKKITVQAMLVTLPGGNLVKKKGDRKGRG